MGISGRRLPQGIEDEFPNLATAGYEITSEASIDYNCIAWAMDISVQRWDYGDPYGYWPPTVPRNQEAATLVQVFAVAGYSVCDNGDKEPGYDKVAIYAQNGLWEHAARQLDDGRWTSKLGDLEDITHPSAESLAGGFYGGIHCIMRRLNGDSE